ncbi:MAG: glycoside hydrolase family 16 protein [Burkholderiales bacterium]|nr:glycoside hydrolase family 16 protein [Burkholderiales bacterium]
MAGPSVPHCIFSVAQWLLAVVGLGLVGACGGGGTSATTAPQAAPPANTSPTAYTVVGIPAGYRLVWQDEFDSSSEQLPDSSKWAYDTARNSVGWYNDEKQYYASGRLLNSKLFGGKLVITARKENLSGLPDWGGQLYSSARLFTKGKASWTYGFFEVRAKLPCGVGTWPAIWSLGASTDIWPLQGEIDIMEQTGWDKTRILGTVHTQSGSGGNGSTGSTQVADACGTFHNYQMTWTPQSISFSVDGVAYRDAYVNPLTGVNSWPFDQPQYLLLNLAIGGTLGGPIDDRIFPVTFEIDYVRVYQKP